ncbi:MAG TPA: cytochrome c biogenesis protein CcsA [Opitutaceae bacterium]|nr:cytochrome c biogenesis protein CcsA [Opitutaceae bacterium]
MKKYLPSLVLALGLLYLGSTLLPPPSKSEFDLRGFGRLPILVNGRIKPLDTVARNTLLVFQGRQRFTAPDGQPLQPIEWLLDVLFNPTVADSYQHFVIHNPDVLSLFGKQGQEYFSFNDLRSGLTELERQEKMAEPIDDQQRSPFQREVVDLYQRLVLYQRLKASVNLEDSPDFLGELLAFEKALPAMSAAFRAKEAGQTYNAQDYKTLTDFVSRFQYLSDSGYLLAIPPAAGTADPNGWQKAGDALLATFRQGEVNPDVMAYGALGHAWRLKQPQQFNEVVRLYTGQLAKRFAPQLQRCRLEALFNQAQPFYSGMILYVLAVLLALVSWLKWPDVLQPAAFWIIALAFAASTVGIATRMWLEGRPPVTNLYSSALFVGWVAVALCLVLERIYRNAIGAVAGGLIGFGTLVIAHHLSLSGDTMEMMRAVLDSNYWLATHVVTVTMGYGSTYLAGFLAIIYIVRGLFTRSLDKGTADALTRMVYGIVCFATLFSFVGTVLGGIWADQSWGRFWGWDPKENGALIIVLWNAIILHCRWAGMVRQRGLMMLAVFGNVVTSWSYFGTNLLGVGLHSYGFTQGTFVWLVAFAASQVLIIALAAIPLDKWRSFRRAPAAT